MAIHVYRYDNVGAPDLTAEPAGESLQALFEYVLPLQGWTIVHDTTRRGTGTSTDGRIIFERPGADFVFWMDNEGTGDFIVGLADAGFPDGSLTHPQTGERQGGSSTNVQKVDDSSPYYWGKWLVIYDDASHSFVFRAANVSNLNYGNSNALQPAGYIGTADNPASLGYSIPVLYVGELTTSSASTKNAFLRGEGTTLIDYDGSPSSEGTRLEGGTGFNVSSMHTNSLTSGDTPYPYIPLKKMGIACTSALTGGSTINSVEVGVLRGCLAVASHNPSYGDPFFSLNFPTEHATGDCIDNPILLEGKTYYCMTLGVLLFISTDPDDWVF